MPENSNKKPRFLPDPTKWIQTAPTSSTKKAQRLLTSLRNGFATPPTTIRRPASSASTQVKKQGSTIGNGFFTPTPKNVEDSAKKRGSPSIKGVKTETTLRKSRLAVRADERRSSPTDDVELDTKDHLLRNQHRPSSSTRPKAVPLQTHRSAPVSSSSGMSDALDQDQHTPPRKRRRTTSLSPLFPPGSPVASHMSSDRPITPVPDYVLDIHRRLCGREFTRLKSPETGSPAKSKTRKEREREKEQRAIDERAHDRALVRRRNREKENEHRLVVGSSQSNGDRLSPKQEGKRKRGFSPVDIPRLMPIVVNTVHHSPSINTSRAARRNGINRPVAADAYSPSAVYKELCDPTSPRILTPPKSRQLRRIPTGTSPRSAIPITSPSPSPAPKSISPVKAMALPEPLPREFEAVPMQAETLLSWGGESRTPIRPEPRPIQHHHPGPEEVDSTETQSLAPSAASQSFPNIIPSPTRPVPAMFAHLDRPQTRPPAKRTSLIKPETIRRTTTLERSSNTGIPTSRSIARFPTTLGVAETIISPDDPKMNHAKPTPKPATVKQSRSSGSGWPAFGFDEATPTQAARSRADRSPSSSSKKRKTTSATTGAQSKLAAFGFFGEKSKKPIKGFEEDWEMEDDLPFDDDLAPDANDDNQEWDARRQEETDRRLQAVPLPPPHPSLRPAGLRELKRLEATRSTRPLVLNHDNEHEYDTEIEELFPEVQPSSSSSHTPTRHGGSSTSASSVTTESELGMNSSAVAWWDGLEDRRSSEFGSVPRLS